MYFFQTRSTGVPLIDFRFSGRSSSNELLVEFSGLCIAVDRGGIERTPSCGSSRVPEVGFVGGVEVSVA